MKIYNAVNIWCSLINIIPKRYQKRCLHRLANLRVGQSLEIGNGAIFGSMITYETGENGAKISSISHSNGLILVGQSCESQAKWVRVGKPGQKESMECHL